MFVIVMMIIIVITFDSIECRVSILGNMTESVTALKQQIMKLKSYEDLNQPTLAWESHVNIGTSLYLI